MMFLSVLFQGFLSQIGVVAVPATNLAKPLPRSALLQFGCTKQAQNGHSPLQRCVQWIAMRNFITEKGVIATTHCTHSVSSDVQKMERYGFPLLKNLLTRMIV
jgi:hypothetical protein